MSKKQGEVGYVGRYETDEMVKYLMDRAMSTNAPAHKALQHNIELLEHYIRHNYCVDQFCVDRARRTIAHLQSRLRRGLVNTVTA